MPVPTGWRKKKKILQRLAWLKQQKQFVLVQVFAVNGCYFCLWHHTGVWLSVFCGEMVTTSTHTQVFPSWSRVTAISGNQKPHSPCVSLQARSLHRFPAGSGDTITCMLQWQWKKREVAVLLHLTSMFQKEFPNSSMLKELAWDTQKPFIFSSRGDSRISHQCKQGFKHPALHICRMTISKETCAPFLWLYALNIKQISGIPSWTITTSCYMQRLFTCLCGLWTFITAKIAIRNSEIHSLNRHHLWLSTTGIPNKYFR